MYFGNKKPVGRWVAIATGFMIPFIVWGALRMYHATVFSLECGNNLARTAIAADIGMAKQELNVVLTYLEKQKLTDGFTSVLWEDSSQDLGFFYKNLKIAYDELEKVSPEASQLEKTNVLMKLRETVCRKGQVIVPSEISIHPNNTAYFIFGWLSFGLLIVSIVYWFKVAGEKLGA